MRMMMGLLASLMILCPCNAGVAWPVVVTDNDPNIGEAGYLYAQITRQGQPNFGVKGIGPDMTKPPGAGEREDMTCGKRSFERVTFGPVRGTIVFVNHNKGSLWMPAVELPPDVQKRLGFDPERLAAARRAERAAKKK